MNIKLQSFHGQPHNSRRPKSLTLQLELGTERRDTFRSSFPNKKYSEVYKPPSQKYTPVKTKMNSILRQNSLQKQSLAIDATSMKKSACNAMSRIFSREDYQNFITPKMMYRPKLKYKLSRAVYSNRANTVNSGLESETVHQELEMGQSSKKKIFNRSSTVLQPEQQSEQQHTPIEMPTFQTESQVLQLEFPAAQPQPQSQPSRLTCFIFGVGQPSEQEEEKKRILKSSNLYLRTTNGKKQKVDGYMYIKKIKSRCDQRVRTQASCLTAQNIENIPQRHLYIRKENQSRRKSYLTSGTNLAQHAGKRKERSSKKDRKHEYRPWSAGKSDASD